MCTANSQSSVLSRDVVLVVDRTVPTMPLPLYCSFAQVLGVLDHTGQPTIRALFSDGSIEIVPFSDTVFGCRTSDKVSPFTTVKRLEQQALTLALEWFASIRRVHGLLMDENNYHQTIPIEHICRQLFNLSASANLETVQILSTLITLTAENRVLFQIENTPLEPGQQWHEIVPIVTLKQQNIHANIRREPYSDLQPVYALRLATVENSIVNMRHSYPKEMTLYIEALHASHTEKGVLGVTMRKGFYRKRALDHTSNTPYI
ncbi:hypothetical protein BWQ96_09571 [Gracilariopsis chorda]|uniref:Uncharacterized protein n=1 Tax=Gracilariopsis chorda TaxID=448386 RepID=A0A2V3IFD4_9FLOR|nr:hypothetical protein BWQ96_09571 [Gracilariopsis chorda]|eukprot:PXF40738.1 hypothetical protein BWQ96_09571 [Gracilariopsis chorda]